MDEQEAKFIELITHLPSDVNPYLVAAKELEASIRPPASPTWERYLKIVFLILEEIMFFQSLLLLYQRLRISKRAQIKRNSLGLVIVNISYIAAFSYVSYSLLAIYNLLVQIAVDWGHKMDEAWMLLVFALRFFTVMVGSWAFLWVCACQCALILWNSDWVSKMNRDRLKLLIQWCSSFLILLFAFGPLPAIAWQYVKAHEAYRQIESIGYDISSKLRSQAESYDPLNMNQLNLLSSLMPAKKILPLRDELERKLRLGQKLYLADLSFLSLIYVPLLVISLRHLYKQSKYQAEIDASIVSDQPAKESVISRRIRRQRQRLVFHAVCVYFATSIHLPVLIYEIVLSNKPGFVRSPTWNQLTFSGLTASLCLTGNIILLVLNLHSYLILREKTHPQLQNLCTSAVNSSDLNILQKAKHFMQGFVRSSEETALELEELATYKIDKPNASRNTEFILNNDKALDLSDFRIKLHHNLSTTC